MYIRDLHIPGKEGVHDLLIEKDKIAGVFPRSAGGPAAACTEPFLSLPGAIVFPGLINSHDHLDFNLFPLLGNRIYNNYTAWGRDIHSKNAADIRAVLRVPPHLRIRWGLYKNLLNGFTTVVNHGEKLETGKELINVHQDCHNLHSVGFEKNWKWKLNRPRRSPASAPGSRAASGSGSGPGTTPFVLHVGEGTDAAAGREIDRLIRWNLFKRPLIGVHGVAMDERQAAHFKALVWCPDSNYFLLGRTAPMTRLHKKVPLLFGTDSTLTAGWNHWDQIRLARKEGAVTDEELLEMLTKGAANIWGFKDRGEIAEGKQADLVIADAPSLLRSSVPSSDPSGMDGFNPPGLEVFNPPGIGMAAFYTLNPENILLVLHKGNIRLFDESLLPQLAAGGFDPAGFHKITIQGKGKYTEGDLPALMTAIRQYHPEVAFPPGIGIP